MFLPGFVGEFAISSLVCHPCPEGSFCSGGSGEQRFVKFVEFITLSSNYSGCTLMLQQFQNALWTRIHLQTERPARVTTDFEALLWYQTSLSAVTALQTQLAHSPLAGSELQQGLCRGVPWALMQQSRVLPTISTSCCISAFYWFVPCCAMLVFVVFAVIKRRRIRQSPRPRNQDHIFESKVLHIFIEESSHAISAESLLSCQM